MQHFQIIIGGIFTGTVDEKTDMLVRPRWPIQDSRHPSPIKLVKIAHSNMGN